MLETFSLIFFCCCLLWTQGLRAEADMWREEYYKKRNALEDLEMKQATSVRIVRVFSGGKDAA